MPGLGRKSIRTKKKTKETQLGLTRSKLSRLRQRTIPKKVSDYSSPVSKHFFSILRKEMTRMHLRGKKPSDFRHTVFVSSVREMISLLPPKDIYRRSLIKELNKDPNYQIPADACEVAVRNAFLKPLKQGGKKVPVQYIFVGKRVSVKERAGVFKVIARKMVDPRFNERITARVADNRLKGVLSFR